MKRGFTLIEVLATLILVSITGVFVGHLYAVTVGNYLIAVESADRAQQRAIAHERLIKEFNWAAPGSVILTGSTSAEWQSTHPDIGVGSAQSLSLSGNNLLLNGQPLLERVSAFNIDWDGETVHLDIDGWSARIYPRRIP